MGLYDNPKRWPACVTMEAILAALGRYAEGLDNPGFCLCCGHEQDGCEPDARNHDCESCGEPEVYGAAELLLVIA